MSENIEVQSENAKDEEETFSVNVRFTKTQIFEFFGNLTEMYHDSDEKYLDETFCISESQKKNIEEKQDLGYAYLYVNPKGEKYITMGQAHGESLMAGIEYHLKHSPEVVMEQLQKILFATGRAHELMDNMTDYGSEDLLLETMAKFQTPNQNKPKP